MTIEVSHNPTDVHVQISLYLKGLGESITNLKSQYEDQISQLAERLEKTQSDKDSLSIKYVKCKNELDRLTKETTRRRSECQCKSSSNSVEELQTSDSKRKETSITECSITEKSPVKRTPKKLSSLALKGKNILFKDVKFLSYGPEKSRTVIGQTSPQDDKNPMSIPETCHTEEDLGLNDKRRSSFDKSKLSFHVRKENHSTPIGNSATKTDFKSGPEQVSKSILDSTKSLNKLGKSVENETVLTGSLNVIESSVNVTENANQPCSSYIQGTKTENAVERKFEFKRTQKRSSDELRASALNSKYRKVEDDDNNFKENEIDSIKNDNNFKSNKIDTIEKTKISQVKQNDDKIDDETSSDEGDGVPSPIISRSRGAPNVSNKSPALNSLQTFQSQQESMYHDKSTKELLFNSSRKTLSASKAQVMVSDTPSPQSKRRLVLTSATEKTNIIPDTFAMDPLDIPDFCHHGNETELDSMFFGPEVVNSSILTSGKKVCSTQIIDRTKIGESVSLQVSPVEANSKEIVAIKNANRSPDNSPIIVEEQTSFSQPCEVLKTSGEKSKPKQFNRVHGIRPRAAKITYTKSFYPDGQSKLKLVPKKTASKGKKVESKFVEKQENKAKSAREVLDQSVVVLQDSYDVIPSEDVEKPKFKFNKVVRDQAARQQMTGKSCKDCEEYYRSAGLGEDEIAKRIDGCSRHRVHYTPPKTPKHFWSLDFPPTPVEAEPNRKAARRDIQCVKDTVSTTAKQPDEIKDCLNDNIGVGNNGRAKRRRPLANHK